MAINKAKMKCNKPRRTADGPKKFVVKACQDGTEKIIRFGDSNMRIKKSNPKARNHSVQGTNAARLNPNLRPDIGHAGTGKWSKVQKILKRWYGTYWWQS